MFSMISQVSNKNMILTRRIRFDSVEKKRSKNVEQLPSKAKLKKQYLQFKADSYIQGAYLKCRVYSYFRFNLK